MSEYSLDAFMRRHYGFSYRREGDEHVLECPEGYIHSELRDSDLERLVAGALLMMDLNRWNASGGD